MIMHMVQRMKTPTRTTKTGEMARVGLAGREMRDEDCGVIWDVWRNRLRTR